MHVEGIPAIDDIAVVELARLDSIAYDITVSTLERGPEQVCHPAVLRITYHLDVIHNLPEHGRSGSEYAEVLDAEERVVIAGHICNLHISCAHAAARDLVVVVPEFLPVVGLVQDLRPVAAV